MADASMGDTPPVMVPFASELVERCLEWQRCEGFKLVDHGDGTYDLMFTMVWPPAGLTED
jgi:hypothetical protein